MALRPPATLGRRTVTVQIYQIRPVSRSPRLGEKYQGGGTAGGFGLLIAAYLLLNLGELLRHTVQRCDLLLDPPIRL